MVKLTQHDLNFILDQIELAEEHNRLVQEEGMDPGEALRLLVDNPLLPNGLRTVDGSFNNLVPGRELWGASGEAFPRLTTPNWVNEDDDSIIFGAGTPGQIEFTDGNYGKNGPPSGVGGLGGGTLVDADPRTISNLIVDQTLNNPAVIAAALRLAGHPESEIMDGIAAIRTAMQAHPDALEGLAGANLALTGAQEAYNQAVANLIAETDPAAIPALIAAVSAAATAQAEAQVAVTAAEDAVEVAEGVLSATLDDYGVEMDGNSVLLRNVSPDEGLSASYNGWFTLFGQFFDHGLDLVSKGGNGTVYIPLQPDDPLYNPDSPHTNFMAMTRATVGEGAGNVTTPWVDQNQTYTSNASHQLFLREYEMVDGRPVSTGHLLEGDRGMATWADVKEQARTMLGIELTDADVTQVPVFRMDPYGEFIRGPNGLPQILAAFTPDGEPIYVEGNLASPINPSAIQLPVGTVIMGSGGTEITIAAGETVSAARTGNAFLDDIAHAAVPIVAGGVLQQDADDAVGYSGGFNTRGQQTQYDDELLDAHYITGDGRGNENIGLTAVHHVFHSEHNRQVDEIKKTAFESGDLAFLNQWLATDVTSIPATMDGLAWDGERLFQAARFATEMQYQHLVFEEFARKIQPDVDIFLVEPDVELNPAIFAEFANVVYRFGHSMLNQTVDQQNADGSVTNMELFDAFLNPLAFGSDTVDHREAAAAIVRGMTMQVGNEIDEFVTDVLRNQLVGIPLDLAALNIARGRDTGMPTLNQARAQFQDMATGDTLLRPYTSWTDFALNMRNPESVVNFIAAYGTHGSITAETTIEGKRGAAMALVFGGAGAPGDRLDFLNATGAYAGGSLGGLNDVDLWIGGLAEKKMAFGGMLGSTFSFVFQMQMENLQDSDRFYYLSRTQGLNLLTELENNSLAKMVKKNTDMDGFALPADIFSTPDHILYMDYNKQLAMTNTADPTHENAVLQGISSLVERRDVDGNGVAEYIRYNGLDHIVIQGTGANDHIVAGGGDDTVWGEDGDDRIEAGYGVDSINGGAGDDIITSAGTDIGAVSVLKGESGNDVIVDGTGMSLIFGGDGKDYIVSGFDDGEIRGGQGDDFIYGGDGMGMLFGNEGNDWVEGGAGFDFIAGDMAELFFNSTIIGHDVLNGGQGDTDYDADSGDDIMFGGEGIQKNIGMWGHDWVTHQGQASGVDADMRVDIFTTLPNEVLRDRFSQVEALSGWNGNDVLRGDDRTGADAEGGTTTDPTPETGFRYNELNQAGIDRIAGLSEIITPDLMQTLPYWATGSWENGATGITEAVFVGGNILLGGGGNDTIEGRGGDDVIDGDRYLSVKLAGVTKDGIAFSVASMEDSVTLGGVTKSLTSWMIDGRINPGAMEIVREILSDDGGEDTAVFWDVLENYAITSNGNGGLRIEHVDQTGGAIDPVTGRNRESDGVDQVYNVEWLQFGDQRISTVGLINTPATGAPVISDLTPTEGQALTVNTSAIGDENGLGAFSYAWQVSSDNGVTWNNVLTGGTGASFTPAGGQVGGLMRVSVSFTDGAGHQETLVSAPTGVVGDNWDAIPFLANTFNGTAGDDIADGTSGLFGAGAADTLNGNGGNDILNGAGGNDTLNGGAGDDRLDGGAGTDVAVFAGNIANFALASNGTNLVVTDLTGAEGTDTLSTIETLRFAGANYSVVAGTAANNANLNGASGAAGSQAVFGFAGTDTLNGGGGNDLLVGGQGNDSVNGGAGNDTAYWSVGDGRDFVNGGADTDTVKLMGDASAETFRIYSRAAALAAGLTGLNANAEIIITRNGTTNADIIAELDNIEEIVINGRGGGDTFLPIGDFAPTSLSTSTITIEGSDGDDVVDIGALQSAHRVVFKSSGGDDVILGQMREQDRFELADGKTLDDYTATENADGSTTLASEGHSVTFFGTAANAGGASASDDDDDHDHGDDNHDDDEDAPPPSDAGTLTGTAGSDVLKGGSGDDVIRGRGGDDTLSGGSGDDEIEGGAGDDVLSGGSGDDVLAGGGGDDVLGGGSGDDRLDGGAGDDVMTGGSGDDVFVFSGGDDRVTDFDVDGDVIDLSALGITAANFAARVAMAQSGDGMTLRIDGHSMQFDAMTAGDLAGASFRFAGGSVGNAPLAAPAEGGAPPAADLDTAPQAHGRWLDPVRDWWLDRADMVRNDWDYV